VRIDLFLKASRLCPRRTVAQQLCDAGLVLLNGRPAKAAHAVKAGDEISIRRRERETVARVLNVPDHANVSRREAGELIEVSSEKQVESETWPPDRLD
jgi:ribosomal 50S subunit-recycling heat shock protein